MDSIQTVSKAIAGAIAAGLTAWLVKKGIVLTPEVSAAVVVIIAGAIGFGLTYLAPKNKQ